MNRLVTLIIALLFLAPHALADTIGADDRAAVLAAVIDHLEKDYVKPKIGAGAAQALQEERDNGRFDGLTDGETFALRLSERLKALTGDGHLNIDYSAKTVAPGHDDDFSAAEMERWYGAQLNFGVEKVERLDGNVGLLDLRVFAPIDMGGDTVAAAMTVLAHTDALVIDLRHNGGGIGDMANLVASYLFGTTPMPLTGTYDRPSDTLSQQYTQAYVPGARFGPDKPVYVLISKQTFSAAEALAYNLQALKRATIVGEASGGGAHPFEYLPIHPHFVLWSVTAMSVNPITRGNWQGTGVEPDIKVPADQALEAALDDLSKNRTDDKVG